MQLHICVKNAKISGNGIIRHIITELLNQGYILVLQNVLCLFNRLQNECLRSFPPIQQSFQQVFKEFSTYSTLFSTGNVEISITECIFVRQMSIITVEKNNLWRKK